MKIYTPPVTPPQIADMLVIDAAELHRMQVHAEARIVTLWFTYRRKKDGTREAKARDYVRHAIKKFRELLAKPVPAADPILRLEAWQIETEWADYSKLESAELARRLRMQKALLKMLCTHDPRWRAVSDNNDRLLKEAGTRFAGLFAPVVLDLAA